MNALRVGTWNIHGFIGSDGRLDVDRTADVLGGLSLDVAGLQEVDRRNLLPGGGDRLEYLAEKLGFHATFGPTVGTAPSAFGNALLTRSAVANVEYFDVTAGPWEPRGILSADLEVAGRTLRVMVTHFGLRAAERRAQLQVLLEHVGQGDRPVLLMGDFNEWRPRAWMISRLNAALGRAPRVRTFPSRFPVLALDRIWVRPERALTMLSSIRHPAARRASDHLPVVAQLELD